jgi:hypothetical protein
MDSSEFLKSVMMEIPKTEMGVPAIARNRNTLYVVGSQVSASLLSKLIANIFKLRKRDAMGLSFRLQSHFQNTICQK